MRRTCQSARVVLAGAWCVAASVASAPATFAQVPAGDEDAPVVFRATTALVQFDAIIVDPAGHPVVTLVPDDFEVRQDGQRVELRDVTFIDRATRLRDVVHRTDGVQVVTPRPGIDVDALLFLIDDMMMTPDGFVRVKDGLRTFIGNLPAGIEVGILRTGETGRRETALTADRRTLTERVDAMRYLARSLRGGTARSGAAAPGYRDLERTFVDGTLGSLTSLLVSLRELPGRKTVVVLSEGVALWLGTDAMTQPIEGRLNRLAQLAADAGVVVHTVDVSGVPSDGAGDLARRVNMRDGMTTVAERTGGVYFGLANDLSQPLARIADLERGYYLLSYVPPDGTFVDREPAPFRRLTVTVRDPRHRVLTRPGFFGRR